MADLDLLLELMFWSCFALVAYTYVGYPLVIGLMASLFGRPDDTEGIAAGLPRVSLLVAAHNEEDVIAARLDNALAADYPAERLEVVVATDGCTDRTADIVRRYADRGVRLIESPKRRGKATTLNEAVPQLAGEVVVLSDANTFFQPDAIRRMAGRFDDPGVGVVCGQLVLTDPTVGTNADGLYWRYETFLKKCEGRLGALLGANGGIYALRRSVFRPVPADTIVDDFVIPLEAKLRSGCGITYDRRAVAHEETPPTVRAEFRRRARIGAGGFQCLGLLWRLLNPARGWIAFTFWSHKVFRWAGPFFLLGMATAAVLLARHPLYRSLLLAQIGFYGLSVAMPLVPSSVRVLKPLRLTTMFTGMNLALLLGFWRWLAGTQGGVWQRTERAGAGLTPAGV